MIRLSRNPVTPRNPPMLFLIIFQILSANVGRYCSRFGITLSALASSCCRSAELILAGAVKIASTGDSVVCGAGVGAADGVGEVASGGVVLCMYLTRPED